MIRRPPRSTLSSSSAASDVYKRQVSTQSTGNFRSSTMALLKDANAAFVDEDYEAALDLYTQCVDSDPSPEAYVNRSHTNVKLGNYADAVKDAEDALSIDNTFVKGYLRKGIALFETDDFEPASEAFQAGARLAPENAGLKTWIRKCAAELKLSQPNDGAAPPMPKASGAPAEQVPQTMGEKCRYEWYQNTTHVIVTVFAKNRTAEHTDLQVQDTRISYSVQFEDGSEFKLSTPLFDCVVPEECTERIAKPKIELKLRKKSDVKWEAFDRADGAPVRPMGHVLEQKAASAYSSKKDWDAVDADCKQQIDEDKPQGEAALNALFQDIYSKADEETRRAMNKSFQTSGGTVLSTNWGEVGTKDYEEEGIKGPDGMEWRKHGE
eukprot:TRINITY_DN2974_c0_g1_i2.p1 TRINITY_DN2974_c0_g1~~TRINITY_DN2974_c0_g1_i2.p1  ORF type:complete len:380 (+),score=123.49 TRINITY_DN2974_c0_g1_i2:81-1220(+)